jgi:hypothetical protein
VLKRRNVELEINQKICDSEGGQNEVECSNGRIDVMKSDEIIEIKNSKNWKGGLGQVLAYSIDHPNKRKRLHLFECGKLDKEKVVSTCNHFDVTVAFE